MGVTISHKLGQNKVYIKDTLDQAQRYAESIKSDIVEVEEIRRINDYKLHIDITGCESLSFVFKSVEEIESKAKDGWDYVSASFDRKLDAGYMIEEYPENEKYYCAEFCKTQFAKNIMAHKLVADIIKVVASRCFLAEISDEGDYYHSGKLGDAISAIKENGALIDSLTGALTGLGWDNKQIVKGSTTIGK